MNQRDRRLLRILYSLFFLSGATGLIYQVLWIRLLANIVGSTSVAMTCVVTIFILCLSLGALLAAGISEREKRALQLYAFLELAVGVLGCAVTLALLKYNSALANLVGHENVALELALQMMLTLLMIGPATICMGATFPIITNAIAASGFDKKHVTLLYGTNTIGGALGTLLCGFILIWKIGITGTAQLALGVAIFISATAFALSRGLPSGSRQSRPGSFLALQSIGIRTLTLAFLIGFAAISYELLWARVAKLLLGDRTMAASTLLFVYLACLATGSLITNRVIPKPTGSKSIESAHMSRFALILGVSACAHLLSLWVMHSVLDSSLVADWVATSALPRAAIMLVVLVVPVVTLGISLPFLMATNPQLSSAPARVVGSLYFVNSVGSALGGIFGGFTAPRTIGTVNGMIAIAFLLVLMSIWCVARFNADRQRVAQIGACAVCLCMIVWFMPKSFYFYSHEEQLVDTHEDEYGFQLVTRDQDGDLKVRNNRIFIAYKLGPIVTSFAQESIAYFSCVTARACDEVLNIGTGYGITAGAFTRFSEVKNITTIEMLPYLFDNQRMFSPYNFDYFDDPRVVRVNDDGRHALARNAGKKYDIISVNVLDPYIPGSSGLFTVEFWELARDHLRPGGVYSQLLWGPDIDLLFKGLMSVFPHFLAYPSGYSGSYNVVASMEPFDGALHLERVEGRVVEALQKFGLEDQRQARGYFRSMLRRTAAARRRIDKLVAESGEQALHTDDLPVLEYRWANKFERVSIFDSHQVYDW